jgi:hypothetical protein
VDPSLRVELQAILAAAQARGIPIVVVGGAAVRTYLREPDLRRTKDLDFVVAPCGFDAALRLLDERGFRRYDTGLWWRAERGDGVDRIVADLWVGAVVDAGSYESYPLDPMEAEVRAEPGASSIPVPHLEDLLALKLLAHRDKDMLDVVALLADRASLLDAARFRRNVERRDLEVAVRRGYLAVVAALDAGDLARLWEQRFGRPLASAARDGAVAALHRLFP